MAIKDLEVVETPARTETNFPVPRTRPPQKEGVAEHFADSNAKTDLTELPVIGPFLKRVLKKRQFQFSIILPSQILFWLVVISGFFGILEPTKNFGTAITWYLWFTLVFALTLTLGRAWCVTCPFGGLGEWLQRRTLWKRAQKTLGLGWKLPPKWAAYGLIFSAFAFLALTWLEEFFNIAGPGAPILTSYMVLGIIGFAIPVFLLFERRTFCRYLCPLSSLIGSAGATGVVAGFRPKNRETCLNCQTKDCMRGGEKGYGCPWYTYPASSDTNAYCGLCSECYKACPYDNIGMMVQKPLTSVVAPKKRTDLAWVTAILFGLVIFQQWNALSSYQAVDGWLNNLTHFPSYPNPVDYIGAIALVVGALAGIAFLLSKALSLKTKVARSFNSWFAPVMYGLIPLMGADYMARVMPKFLNNVAKIVPAITGVFGSQAGASLADFHILPADWVIRVQYIIVSIGVVAAIYATSRIAGKDLKDITKNQSLARVLPVIIIVAMGAGIIALYFAMNGAE